MPPIADLVKFAQLYAPLALTVGAMIAMWAILQNIAINQRNKRADCIFHCNNRYDDIYKYKSSIIDKHASRPKDLKQNTPDVPIPSVSLDLPKSEPDEAKHYYARYWGLKSDEFDYWLAKLIDLDTIVNWAFLTVNAFRENPVIHSAGVATDFRNGWLNNGLPDNDVINPWFTEFTTVLFRLGALGIQDRNIEHAILLDLFECIERESNSYRKTLQHEMTVKSYRKTREEKKKLSLASALDASVRKHHLGETTYGEHI
jgi:hypothetical protein